MPCPLSFIFGSISKPYAERYYFEIRNRELHTRVCHVEIGELVFLKIAKLCALYVKAEFDVCLALATERFVAANDNSVAVLRKLDSLN